jgi:voltage-gated potassium channel
MDLLYRQLFASMSRREFLLLWEMGDPRLYNGQQLVREGEKQAELVLLLDGEVSVRKGGHEIARLGRGTFVAEMSFVTGEPASADVIADGAVRCLAWPQEKLHHLERLNPALLVKLQKILARDLSGKVKAANRSVIGSAAPTA